MEERNKAWKQAKTKEQVRQYHSGASSTLSAGVICHPSWAKQEETPAQTLKGHERPHPPGYILASRAKEEESAAQ
jgi:hypothetical protein